jgi:hypothetical protein
LEVLKDFLELTDAYPSGLVWKKENRWHKSGEMAGRWTGKYYLVRMLADQYHAHRIVYYMRTGIEPGDGDVVHLRNNPSKDNRKELVFYDGKTKLSNVKNPAYIKTRFKIS